MRKIILSLLLIATIVTACSKAHPTINSVTAAERCSKAFITFQADSAEIYSTKALFEKWSVSATEFMEELNSEVMGKPYRNWIEFKFTQPTELDKQKSTNEVNYVKVFIMYTDYIRGSSFYRGLEMKMVIEDGEWKCERYSIFAKLG